jgi:hypothetical protein
MSPVHPDHRDGAVCGSGRGGAPDGADRPQAHVGKLRDERPALRGIALPGMPAGPPGMGGSSGIYRVLGFTADGQASRFADIRV